MRHPMPPDILQHFLVELRAILQQRVDQTGSQTQERRPSQRYVAATSLVMRLGPALKRRSDRARVAIPRADNGPDRPDSRPPSSNS